MTDPMKDLFRRALLVQLHDGPRRGLTAPQLWQGAQAAGFNVGVDEIHRAADYLRGKGLVAEERSTVAAGATRYSLTAAGTDFLESEGELG